MKTLIALAFVAVLSLPFAVPAVHAQTAADLQAQLAVLLQQVQLLQAQLAAQQGGSIYTAPYAYGQYSFSRTLSVGSTGTDVRQLQQFLSAQGYTVTVYGGGTSEINSSYFGPFTQLALSKWQIAHGITASGNFDEQTRQQVTTASGSTYTNYNPTYPYTYSNSALTVQLTNANPSGNGISYTYYNGTHIPVMRLSFTAGSASDVVVNSLNFTQSGSTGVQGSAYLSFGNAPVSSYIPLAYGTFNFAGLNMRIPAGTTQIVELDVDLPSGSYSNIVPNFSLQSASSVQAQTAGGSYVIAQGAFPLVGSSYNSGYYGGTQQGLVASMNSLLVSPFGSRGTSNVRIGSYALLPTVNEESALQQIVMQTGFQGSSLANLRLQINGANFGATQALVSSNATYTFTGAFRLGQGTVSYVDVYADVLSTATANGISGPATTLVSASSRGVSTGLSYMSGLVQGQTFAITN